MTDQPEPTAEAAEPPEDDLIDGCELDFQLDPDDEETAELRAIYPQGADTDPELVAETLAALEALAVLDA